MRTVSVGIWFATGSRDDPPGRAGLAHLLEHLVFKGSSQRGARALAEAMDALGGQFNAFTTREHTCFHARTLARRLPEALDLLAEMVVRPRLDPKELVRERQVVLDELALIADDPGECCDELFCETLWQKETLGRPQAGTPASVRSITASDVGAFFGTNYVARRAVVAIAGAVQPERAAAAAAAALMAMPAGSAAPARPRPGAGQAARRAARRSEQAHLIFGTAGPGEQDEARWAAGLFAATLGGGSSSRLFQALREDRGLCYDVGASCTEYSDGGEVACFLATAPANAALAAELAVAETRRLAERGVPAAELARVRAQLIASIWMARESTEARMTHLGRQGVACLPLLDAREVVAAIRAVHGSEVQRFAASLGDPATWAAAYVGPRAQAPGLWAWTEAETAVSE